MFLAPLDPGLGHHPDPAAIGGRYRVSALVGSLAKCDSPAGWVSDMLGRTKEGAERDEPARYRGTAKINAIAGNA
jgi:hypothetical protein